MLDGFEWDEVKARSNARKHDVDFADATLVLFDERALSGPDPSADGETRWIAIGADPNGRILLVVYTWRGDRIRIISARKASRNERRGYEQGL